MLFRSDQKELEKRILEEWKKALNTNTIAVTDNFFDIGGHSVLIPEIISSLSEKIGIDLKILEFFKYPTVKSITEHVLNANLTDSQNDPDEIPNTSSRENLQKKESIRKTSGLNNYASTEEQKAKLQAQRNKFKKLGNK